MDPVRLRSLRAPRFIDCAAAAAAARWRVSTTTPTERATPQSNPLPLVPPLPSLSPLSSSRVGSDAILAYLATAASAFSPTPSSIYPPILPAAAAAARRRRSFSTEDLYLPLPLPPSLVPPLSRRSQFPAKAARRLLSFPPTIRRPGLRAGASGAEISMFWPRNVLTEARPRLPKEFHLHQHPDSYPDAAFMRRKCPLLARGNLKKSGLQLQAVEHGAPFPSSNLAPASPAPTLPRLASSPAPLP